jgi:hypothetical protein
MKNTRSLYVKELITVVKVSWGRFCDTSFASKLTNGPNKLECYVKLGWNGLLRDKSLSLLGPFVSYGENEAL